ncbi:SDR family NAD(P)-dependent oxidoreductase [Zhouia sp. PK063]|uniref:SDR family NAD(P)-dependent oxidoreductase n=1 Tax=Zhouia sp. PK063 TaxID=3373602 RepID=UPI003799B6FB
MSSRKIALVTGGSRGLGKNMAIAIAKKNIDVVITYHTNKSAAEEVVTEIEKNGVTATALPFDAENINALDQFKNEFLNTLQKKFNTDKFDFLINNAGIGINAPIAETTEEQFDTLMNIHFKGVYFLTQKLLPSLSNGGGIVNISSGLARFSGPGYSAYAAMKGAIETFTRYLAKELGERKIKANTVAPGAIETDFGGGAVRDIKQYNDYVSSATALGRAGLPDDIGGVVAFLCTQDAGWINAQRIEVSGGMNI